MVFNQLKCWFVFGNILLNCFIVFGLSQSAYADKHYPGISQGTAPSIFTTGFTQGVMEQTHRLAAIRLLLRIGRVTDALQQAEKLLELAPRNSVVHLEIARLFQQQNQCEAAAEYFKQLWLLFANTDQSQALSQIEQRCKDTWRVAYEMEVRAGHRAALFDAPQQLQMTAEKGSKIDIFCQIYWRGCKNARQIKHKTIAPAVYMAQVNMSESTVFLNRNGLFQSIRFTQSKTITSKPPINNGLLLATYSLGRYLNEQHMLKLTLRSGVIVRQRPTKSSRQTWAGVDFMLVRMLNRWALFPNLQILQTATISYERYRTAAFENKLAIIKTGFTSGGRLFDWNINLAQELQSYRDETNALSQSYGTHVSAWISVAPADNWTVDVMHRRGHRQFDTAKFYLARLHYTADTQTIIRIEHKISQVSNLWVGTEIDRLHIKTDDTFSRRQATNLTVFLRCVF